MRTDRENLPSWVKPALEMGPLVLFGATYVLYRNDTVMLFGGEYGGLVLATLVTIPIILITTALTKYLFGKLTGMQIFVAIMVVVFGGITVWFNDERFIQIRGTIVYSLFAIILAFGYFTRRLYLKMMMNDQIPMKTIGWEKFTKRIIWFFLFMAVTNEITWRFFSNDIWVALDTIGQPVMVFVFFMSQIGLFTKYGKGDLASDKN